ncbi:hypothetical protein [Microbacterium sp. LWH11-1.2]|uniref:VG15 protein n=1 Tax=Microbacterium sp. LWH11-1.2 TaxID=3135258 RepID=UPI0031392B4C
MVTALESKQTLLLVGDDAVDTADWLARGVSGSFESQRLQLLDSVPGVVDYYAEASAALAADFYEGSRADAGVTGSYTADAIVLDRTVKIRRAVVWAADPLDSGDLEAAILRLQTVVRSEVNRPYRDTILANRKRDPAASGWRRIARGAGCGLCRMLADRGAVYRESTAWFAAHPDCNCTCEPVFSTTDTGEPLSVGQFIGSKRNPSPAQKARLKELIAEFE